MARPQALSAQKKKEMGDFLKQQYAQLAAEMRSSVERYTQDEFGEEVLKITTDLKSRFGLKIDENDREAITQGLVSQWMKGESISDLRWIALSKRLNFNPFKIRPDLLNLMKLLEDQHRAWIGPCAIEEGLPADAARLIELFNRADARGKDSILRIAEMEATRSASQ